MKNNDKFLISLGVLTCLACTFGGLFAGMMAGSFNPDIHKAVIGLAVALATGILIGISIHSVLVYGIGAGFFGTPAE